MRRLGKTSGKGGWPTVQITKGRSGSCGTVTLSTSGLLQLPAGSGGEMLVLAHPHSRSQSLHKAGSRQGQNWQSMGGEAAGLAGLSPQ